MSIKKSKRIILDEKKEAEKILLTNPEKYITFNILFLLAKYYYSLGLDYKKSKKKIIEYCMKSEYFNLTLRESSIDKALKNAKFYDLKSFDYKIPITKKEIDKLKLLTHKEYKVALYMLFIAKLDKYQGKKKNKKVKSFNLYYNHDIKTAYYNVTDEGKERGRHTLSDNDGLKLLYSLKQKGILVPTMWRTHVILCADLENTKEVEFIIDASKSFNSQIKYYCIKCGKTTEKNKHDYCDECYGKLRRESKTELQRKYRVDR
jgi:hypothetical protein